MWRTAGAGEFYTYLPSSGQFATPNKALCTVKPFSTCNPTYGASVGRGSFTFQKGVWNQISQRVLLNDAGMANGELELFFNGESVINVGGLMLRGDDAGKIRGIIMQTFFGGMSKTLVSTSFDPFFFFLLCRQRSFLRISQGPERVLFRLLSGNYQNLLDRRRMGKFPQTTSKTHIRSRRTYAYLYP